MPNNKKSGKQNKKFKPKPTKSKSQTAPTHLHCCYYYTHLQALEPQVADHQNLSHPQTLSPATQAAQKLTRVATVDPLASGVTPPGVVNQTTNFPEPRPIPDHPKAGALHPQTAVLFTLTPPTFKLLHWTQSSCQPTLRAALPTRTQTKHPLPTPPHHPTQSHRTQGNDGC